jgi:hypothetical protein
LPPDHPEATVAAADEHPKPIDIAIQGWSLGIDAVRQMPVVIGAGFVAALALNAVTLPLLPSYEEGLSVGTQLLEFAQQIVQGFLLTPVAIAVHRFVLLGEVTGRYALNPFAPRFFLFFIWTAILQLLVTIPTLPVAITGQSEEFDAQFVAVIVSLVVAFYVVLRLLILFPAIAVDARGAHWRNAFADTKGQTGRVFGAILVGAIPFLIVMVPAYVHLGWPTRDNFGPGLAFTVLYSAMYVISICVYAALASKLYAAFASKLSG